MAKNKTVESSLSLDNYVRNIADDSRRKDIVQLVKIFGDASGYEPKMWGESIIGFGSYHYKYASGHEGDAPLAGLSNRVAQISMYIFQEFEDKEKLFSELGKIKTAKACVYIKKLDDVNSEVLKQIIKKSIAAVRKIYE